MKYLQCPVCDSIILEKHEMKVFAILEESKESLNLTQIAEKFYNSKPKNERERKTHLVNIGRYVNKLDQLRITKSLRYRKQRLVTIDNIDLIKSLKIIEF